MLPTILFSALATLAVASPVQNIKPQSMPMRRIRAPSSSASLSKREGEPSDWPMNVKFGNAASDTIYVVQLEIGNPPQTISAQIDTGSHTLYTLSSDCANTTCPTKAPHYNPHKSSSYRPNTNITTPFSRTYADGSLMEGSWVKDTVRMGNYQLEDFPFGLVDKHNAAEKMADTGVSALIGIAWGDLHMTPNTIDPPAFPLAAFRDANETLPATNQPKSWEYGMYLARTQDNMWVEDWNLSLHEDTCTLTLGGVNSTFFDGDINYVPTMPSIYRNKSSSLNSIMGEKDWVTAPDRWLIPLDGVAIGGKKVELGSKIGAIPDSGTGSIRLPPQLYDAVVANIAGFNGSEGFGSMPCDTPNLNATFTLGGQDYPVYWGDLFMFINGTCSPFFLRSTDDEPIVLLGDAFMKNVYTAYRYSPPSVGFAKLKKEYNIQPQSINGTTHGKGSGALATTTTSTFLVVFAALGAAIML